MVAEEHRVIDKHQQQIAGPHHHVELLERCDSSMAAHITGDNLVTLAAEEHFLKPVEGVAAGLAAKEIKDDEHHPEAEGGRHYQIFRPRATQSLEVCSGHILHVDAVDQHLVVHSDAVHIFCRSLHHSGANQVVVYSKTHCEIAEEKLHPSGPEQQASEEPHQSLLHVSLHKYSPDNHCQSHRPHREGTAVHHRYRHCILHDTHQRVSQRHSRQHQKKRGERLAPMLLSFHM